MALSPATIQYDSSGNPVALAPASAIASTQSALVTVGSDYATTAAARIPKVDAQGQQYTTLASATGVQVPVGTNAAGTSTGNFGIPAMGFDAVNNYWRPLAVNASGYPVNSVAYMPTLVGVCQNVVTTTTSGKSMMSVWNGGTNYLRLCAIYAVCPPQITVSGLLTAVQQTYNQILIGGFRITSAPAAGTAGTVANYDAADTIDSKITFAAGATITGEATAPHIIADAAYNPSYPLLYREDAASKEIVIPPGQGFHVRTVAAPAGSVTFQMRMVLTQAAT